MNKDKFIARLRAEMGDLPKDQLDDVVADYEEYFRDGEANGRTQEEVSSGLGDPAKIAKELRAEMRLQQWARKKSVANFGRVVLGLMALGSLNLFLAVPTLVMMVMLMASYVISVALLIVGIVAGASFIPGVNSLVDFDGKPGKTIHVVQEKDGSRLEFTRDGKKSVTIVTSEPSKATPDKPAAEGAPKSQTSITIRTKGDPDADDDDDDDDADADGDGGPAPATGADKGDDQDFDNAVEAVFHKVDEAEGWGVVAAGGLGGGALWMLFNLWVTRLLFRGFVRYARLNYSVLRGTDA